MDSNVKIFSGRHSVLLAEKIAQSYGVPLGNVVFNNFSDGEFQPSFEETVRGQKVFLIQSTPPPFDNLLELLLMIDAAKRASAKEIIAVVPYFGMARQDRKDKPRVPIGAKLAANLISSAGATRIITIDLHADQIQGFFEVPVDHLFASTVFIKYIESLKLKNLTIASPDIGGSKRANAYAKYFNSEIVICYKKRLVANEVEEMKIIGNVKGKDIILVDDMIDTGGTLVKASAMMKNEGANSVRAICTHPVLSGKAYENIDKSDIEELIVSDTLSVLQKSSKIKVLTIANLFADVIKNINNNKSISSQFLI
ncbi:MAG: ribose-phosphate pyrophosphokinase [Flavobacteriales bacterium]|jgi:ribose-phosphate pyrophosphokinase|nr:ribose-phosphate pyrophosphokinase [Flavobacteriales bacterium]|tara:strand:+ start:371 stop:1303 length:933 start_codon:yes stop_codon:yes gene_type:complete